MLRVLTYHRIVADGTDGNPSLTSATADVFESQIRHLAARYRVLSMPEVLDLADRGVRAPPRSVLLTFDDAYRDFGEVAWPILKRFGMPATVFVPTAYPDRPERSFWWDRIHRAIRDTDVPELVPMPGATDPSAWPGSAALPLTSESAKAQARRTLQRRVKRLPHDQAMQLVDYVCEALGYHAEPGVSPVLTWSALRLLADEGVTVAPHTRTHPSLVRLPPRLARAEIRGSIEDVQRELGSVPPVFSYPYGAHNDQVVELAREEGLRLALTCLDGHNPLDGSDPLRLNRTNVTRRSTPLIFRLRLLRSVARVDRWRHRAAG